MTDKHISSREFQRALREQAAKADRPVMAVSVDMRLTLDDLAKLDSGQVQAVFEGVGKLAAIGLGR